MPRGRPKKPKQEDQDSAILRLTIRFSKEDETQRMVYDYLKELPYGRKTDAIVKAICDRATSYHFIKDELGKNKKELQDFIREEIQRSIPQIVSLIIAEISSKNLSISQTVPQNPVVKEKEDPAMDDAMLALSLANMFD